MAIVFLYTNFAYAELSCSANGTKLFYINGVNVTTIKENTDSTTLVSKVAQNNIKKLDSGSIVDPAEGIYNYSTSLWDDSRKLREQLILDADGSVTSEKRRKHFEELVKSDFNLNEAFAWGSLSKEE